MFASTAGGRPGRRASITKLLRAKTASARTKAPPAAAKKTGQRPSTAKTTYVMSAADAREHARLREVAASPAVKGKEATAMRLLADDQFKHLTAGAIVKLVEQSATTVDDNDAAFRMSMAKSIISVGNSYIDADGSSAVDSGDAGRQKAASDSWDRAYARVFGSKGQ